MIDTVRLNIHAGNGGNGCISFLREKYRPNGGPNGGDGGTGGSAYIRGDNSFNTLLHLKFNSTIYVERGGHGGGKDRTGRNGQSQIINVPMGTLIWKEDEDGERYLVADICDNNPVLVAEGGKGGWGNTRFVSPTNQEPLLAQNGERGDRSILFLELKLLADVGLLACPNAGKSTLISRCSRAKPKVADYPFTTVEPVLGVVSAHGQDFVMMEVPGLLEGAHAGIGLGHQFLRHAERARVYVHILDGLADDPSEQYEMLNNELRLFSESLGGKPQVVVVNKIDVTEVRETQGEVTALIREKAKEQGLDDLDVLFMSAVTGEGVNELLGKIVELLAKTAKEAEEAEAAADAVPEPVQWGRSRRTANRITKIVGGFAVESQELERLVAMADTRDRRVLLQLWDQMNKNGIARMLEEAGIEAGDTILIGKAEISWF